MVDDVSPDGACFCCEYLLVSDGDHGLRVLQLLGIPHDVPQCSNPLVVYEVVRRAAFHNYREPAAVRMKTPLAAASQQPCKCKSLTEIIIEVEGRGAASRRRWWDVCSHPVQQRRRERPHSLRWAWCSLFVAVLIAARGHLVDRRPLLPSGTFGFCTALRIIVVLLLVVEASGFSVVAAPFPAFAGAIPMLSTMTAGQVWLCRDQRHWWSFGGKDHPTYLLIVFLSPWTVVYSEEALQS